MAHSSARRIPHGQVRRQRPLRRRRRHPRHQGVRGDLARFFAKAGEAADVLLLCGDLTDYGTAEEAQVLVEELSVVKIPVVAVLGNHDYESGTPEVVSDALKQRRRARARWRGRGDRGRGHRRCQGLCRRLRRLMLGAWGEPAIKLFV